MLNISKHLFNFLYIISFIIGIILITLNQIYIKKTKDNNYIKLQYFNWSFLSHIVVNFIYFYGLYFWISWEVKKYILFLVNTGYVIFIFCGIQVLQCFGNFKIPYGKVLIILSSLFYVITFFFTYEEVKNLIRERTWSIIIIFFVLCELFLILSIAICCFVLLFKWFRYDASSCKQKNPLIPLLCSGVLLYSIFNLYVDTCFCFFRKNTSIWGINIYNLTIIFYISLNAAMIPFIYNKEQFLNIIFENNKLTVNIDGFSIDPSSSEIIKIIEDFHLTEREIEVLNLICHGMSNPDIAHNLFISNNTVKRHVNNIFKKVGVKNRYELISKLKVKQF